MFRDVLQRHYVNHLEGEPSDKRPRLVEPSQQRVSRACLACAETKVRCQGGNPCRRCLTKNIPCRPRPKTTYKQPGRDSRIRTLHSEEPEANNDIGSDHSQSTEQYPRDGLLATGEQTDRSITTSGSSTLGDYPIVGSSLQHAKQISSLTDAPIRFPVQMPLDDCELRVLLHVPSDSNFSISFHLARRRAQSGTRKFVHHRFPHVGHAKYRYAR